MKIAFSLAFALVALTGRPATGTDSATLARNREDALESVHSLDATPDREDRRMTTTQGGSRSLACLPSFIDAFGRGNKQIGFGPIGADKKLLATPFPTFYAPANLSRPFVLCNRIFKLVFPGMVGLTFRAFSNGIDSGCDLAEFYVLLKIYDPINKKVVKRQKEENPPYVLYGNEWPIVGDTADDIKYGSALLPNGVYQITATMHFANGTEVDKASFGTNIYVVSC